jgi:hypothetical protein
LTTAPATEWVLEHRCCSPNIDLDVKKNQTVECPSNSKLLSNANQPGFVKLVWLHSIVAHTVVALIELGMFIEG